MSTSHTDLPAFTPAEALSPAKRVLITGAAGQIGYSLIPLVASGAVCGSQTPVDIVLLDIPQALPSLEGIVMEIQDGAYPLVRSIITTDSLEVAFKGTQVALMVGGFPRLAGMDRKDLLTKNAQIFVAAGKALDQYGDRDCKVCVVANPANTNCFIMKDNCPSIPAENFTCLTRLDHNRALWQLASKAKVPVGDVARVTIWGNHSNTMVPDVDQALVRTSAGVVSARSAIKAAMEEGKDSDEAVSTWISGTFVPTVQTRGAEVIRVRQKSSAMSAANAVADHVRNWLSTVPSERVRANDWVSMGIISKGEYGIQPGLVFSYPVQIDTNGKIKVVENLELSEAVKAGLKATEAELASERDMYFTIKAELAAQQ